MERLRRAIFGSPVGKPHWLIVGLGNPGPRYAETRHNVGFQILDRLAERYDLRFQKGRWRGLLAHGEVEGYAVSLLKPLSYMNRSGEVVVPVFKSYSLPNDRLLIIYDDLDLPLGRMRIRPGGSAGGHKGVNSILDLLGSQVPRLRVGIGRTEGDPVEYVLSPFTSEEKAVMEATYKRAIAAVACLLREGVEAAMVRFNQEESCG